MKPLNQPSIFARDFDMIQIHHHINHDGEIIRVVKFGTYRFKTKKEIGG
jgi:hypothetical protein